MSVSKVLILGAKGVLGQTLAKEFSVPEYEVFAWDRESGDVAHPSIETKIKELNPRLIINATGYNDVDRAETEEGKKLAFLINSTAPETIAKAAKDINAIFVTYSTDYVFNGEKESGYVESDETKPLSVYGQSKESGEEKVQSVNGRYYIIRPSWIFGPAGTSVSSKKNFVDMMIDLVLFQGKQKLEVVDEEISCPTYSVDLAKFTRMLIKGDCESGIYHGANSGSCSRYQLVKEAMKLKNIKVEIDPVPGDFFPRLAARPRYSVLLNTKMPLQRTWQEALAEYLSTRADN